MVVVVGRRSWLKQTELSERKGQKEKKSSGLCRAGRGFWVTRGPKRQIGTSSEYVSNAGDRRLSAIGRCDVAP